MSREMERLVYEEYKKQLEAELSAGEVQQDLQRAIKEGDGDYREAVERSEREVKEDEATLEQELALKDRVDRRMMTESPTLIQNKLRNVGGKIVPDHDAYDRQRRKTKFMEF